MVKILRFGTDTPTQSTPILNSYQKIAKLICSTYDKVYKSLNHGEYSQDHQLLPALTNISAFNYKFPNAVLDRRREEALEEATTYKSLKDYAHLNLSDRGALLARKYRMNYPITRFALQRKFSKSGIKKKLIRVTKSIPR